MTTEIICAGFGGQGVLTMGLILARAGYQQGKNITWYPSYGAEMRGGTANCNVKLSDEEIGNPYCSRLNLLVAMNEPSVERFEEMLVSGGTLLYNSDMVDEKRRFRDDIRVMPVPAGTLAFELQNPQSANVVALGAVAKHLPIFTGDELKSAVRLYFKDKGKEKYNDLNSRAFDAGYYMELSP